MINAWLQDSELFRYAEKSRFKPNLIMNILIFFCLWGGALFLGRLAVVPLIEMLPNNSIYWITFSSSLRKVLICGIQILAFFSWVKFVEKRNIETMGLICRHKARAYFRGLLLGFCSITFIVLFLTFSGAVKINLTNPLTINLLFNVVCVAVPGWIVQSASEEVTIRGWLIPGLGVQYSPMAAILITGGIFGGIHLLNNGVTILSFINLTLSGCFFALYAINAGNIWGVCGLHLGWNFTLGNIYGLSISGEKSTDSSLFITNNLDTDLLTGGDFGPEGSIIVTLFLICAILIISFTLCKKHKIKVIK